MNRAFAIAITLAAAILGVLILFLDRQDRPAKAVTKVVEGTSVAPARMIVSNSLRMKVVVNPGNNPVPMSQSAKFNAKENVWWDAQLIVNRNADYWKRLEAVGRLPSKLTDSDWQLLREFLLRPDALDNDQLGQVLKNEIMDKLCLMSPMPTDFEDVLAKIYENLLQNEVIRDYAVQHLVTYEQELAPQTSNAKISQAAENLLWNALGETGDSIAGTALLGLESLSQQCPQEVDQKKFDAAAMRLANNETAGELTRITAYQVCAHLNLQDALPTIETAAQSSQTISLQISAIGALGLIGGVNDITLLQNLAQHGNGRLQLPIQTAIQRIEQRTRTSAKSS